MASKLRRSLVLVRRLYGLFLLELRLKLDETLLSVEDESELEFEALGHAVEFCLLR